MGDDEMWDGAGYAGVHTPWSEQNSFFIFSVSKVDASAPMFPRRKGKNTSQTGRENMEKLWIFRVY